MAINQKEPLNIERKKMYHYIGKAIMYKSMVRQCVDTGVPAWVFDLLAEANDSNEWDIMSYDGCTSVTDPVIPFPPCFIHDYIWRTGRASKDSERLFKKLLIMFGISPFKAWKWSTGTRLAWLFWFQFKKREKRENTDLLNYAYGLL